MKILLLGKNGLVGSACISVFTKHQIAHAALSHSDCDIVDIDCIKRKVEEYQPTLVINATGFTAVDKAETEEGQALKVNAYAVGALARLCNTYHIPLLHISTDYVFDGKKKDGYFETDIPAPLNVYGKSKAYGEKLLQENTDLFFLIRTSWLFGPHGNPTSPKAMRGKGNFVDTILQLAKTKPFLSVVNDQFGKPTYSLDFAKAILQLIKSQKYGIYHIVNEGITNWYEYAQEIIKTAHFNTPVRPITSIELKQAARRPSYSALINTKLPLLRSWQTAVHAYLNNLNNLK